MKRSLSFVLATSFLACAPTQPALVPPPAASSAVAAASSAPPEPPLPPLPKPTLPRATESKVAGARVVRVADAEDAVALVFARAGSAADGELTGLAEVTAQAIALGAGVSVEVTGDAVAFHARGKVEALVRALAEPVDAAKVAAAKAHVARVAGERLSTPLLARAFVAHRHLFQLPTALHPHGALSPLPSEVARITPADVKRHVARFSDTAATWVVAEGALDDAAITALQGRLPRRGAPSLDVPPPARGEPRRFVIDAPDARPTLAVLAYGDGAPQAVAQGDIALRWALVRAKVDHAAVRDWPHETGPALREASFDAEGDALARFSKALTEAPLDDKRGVNQACREHLAALDVPAASRVQVVARGVALGRDVTGPASMFSAMEAEARIDDPAMVPLYGEKQPFEPLVWVGHGDAAVLAPLLAEHGDVNVLDPKTFARTRTVMMKRAPSPPPTTDTP